MGYLLIDNTDIVQGYEDVNTSGKALIPNFKKLSDSGTVVSELQAVQCIERKQNGFLLTSNRMTKTMSINK